jgi:geranylgeranyl pyrophosphate synthase
MNALLVARSESDDGLRTDALAEAWRYATETPSKQTRSRVLQAAETAARRGVGSPDPRVALASAAVETLHLTSLAHDDVLDAGDVRRGLASLPAHFGAPMAAAAGGLFFGRALSLFARCGEEAVTLATETALRMCEGQMLELRCVRDLGRTPSEYFQAINGKTAGMFWLAACLGGVLGHADPATQEALADYGESVGIAYQIIDDILDLVGSEERTGKPHGNDLKNGNYTLPVIYALEERPTLKESLSAEIDINTIIDEVCKTRAIARSSAEACRWIERSKRAVDQVPAAVGLLSIAEAELRVLDATEG